MAGGRGLPDKDVEYDRDSIMAVCKIIVGFSGFVLVVAAICRACGVIE